MSKKIFDKLVDGEASSPATATLSSFCLNPTDSGRKNCREMMDWLVETVQEYEIPFEPDATTLQNLPDLLMREAENNDKVWWCAETDETLRIHQEALHSLNNRVSGLRFIAENPPEYAVSVTPTLEDLYLYHFKEVSK